MKRRGKERLAGVVIGFWVLLAALGPLGHLTGGTAPSPNEAVFAASTPEVPVAAGNPVVGFF